MLATAAASEVEIDGFIEQYDALKTSDSKAAILPNKIARSLMTFVLPYTIMNYTVTKLTKGPMPKWLRRTNN